jgi:hypothetical protein
MSTPDIALRLPRLAACRWAACPSSWPFVGALRGRCAHAFELTLVELAVLCVAVAALTRLLPRPAGAS